MTVTPVAPLTLLEREVLPLALKNIHRPPKQLWYRGNVELLQSPQLKLAIVGSRQSSWYGSLALKQLLTSAFSEQLIIVSGLALGIDTLAHQTALKIGAPTIAVLGSGLADKALYPASNWSLAQNILANNGLLLSEYPPEETARPYFFPQRNRLIAGLSQAVLVIEAAEKSGALLTARLALEENRDVLAVPGNINQTLSKGCNYLIKIGAQAITSSQDLAQALDLELASSYSETSLSLTASQSALLKLLAQPLNLEQLAQITQQPLDQLAESLADLELNGLIELQADNFYVASTLK
ncbi:MAG TPA: DNA-processing protein DprA [bacterium]|nr:DNA-processing protein DprA [bacterium]